jgi:hypothetical protein
MWLVGFISALNMICCGFLADFWGDYESASFVSVVGFIRRDYIPKFSLEIIHYK